MQDADSSSSQPHAKQEQTAQNGREKEREKACCCQELRQLSEDFINELEVWTLIDRFVVTSQITALCNYKLIHYLIALHPGKKVF